MVDESRNPFPDGEPMERFTQSQLDALVSLHERFLDGRLGGRRAILKRVDISNLSLSDKNLRQADFSGCNMQYMDLAFTNFQEATLYACDLSFSNLIHTNFVRSDLRGTRIESANLAGADLERADLRGGALTADGSYAQPQPVNFRGANMTGAKLIGSMANNADFSDAIMAHTKIYGADLRGARLIGADLSGADFDSVKLTGANMKNAILTGANLEKLINAGVDLSTAITDSNIGPSVNDLHTPLVHLIEEHQRWVETSGRVGKYLDLSGYDLREVGALKRQKLTALKACDAKFIGMNLYQVELQSANLEGADFRNCDLVEADFRGSNLKGTKFSHAKLKGANFLPLLFATGSSQRFAPCNLEGSEFRYADLSDAKLKNAIFRDADLSYANLSGCDLRDADFSGAKLEGVILEGANTTGAIFENTGSKRAFSLSSLQDDK